MNENNCKKESLLDRVRALSFQQYVGTPFSMLLMAAAGEAFWTDGPLYQANERTYSLPLSVVVRKE